MEGTVFMRASLTGNGSSHLGVSSGGVEVDGTVLALPEMEAPHLGVSSGGVEVDGGFAKVAGNSREKKHKVEENYSSEVSPPCREKTVRIRKFCEGFPTHFSENFLEGFHDFSQFCEGFLTHFSDVV